ncbi:hypothetical protein ISS37_05255 [candidate division KSB1 bacterium]|nr:hypothetical protein [candidate division KSB1 bacterium]
MYLLIIILNKEEYLGDLLSVLIELGVMDATIVDSEAIGKALAVKVPIFAGLRLRGDRIFSKTIFALVEDKNTGDEIVHLLKDIGIDLLTPGVGRIVTIKVESALGTPSPPDIV